MKNWVKKARRSVQRPNPDPLMVFGSKYVQEEIYVKADRVKQVVHECQTKKYELVNKRIDVTKRMQSEIANAHDVVSAKTADAKALQMGWQKERDDKRTEASSKIIEV